jgi:Zn-finger protein
MRKLNPLNKDQKLDWAKSEYRKRIQEAKNCKWFGDKKNLEKVWDNRRKIIGISKDECSLLIEKAAYTEIG